MPHIPESFKDELRQQVNLADVIGLFTEVKKTGNHYIAKCPFHSDEHPSMMINLETQTFSCFSCGAGSKNHSHIQSPDVYSFLKGVLNVNFYEAIEWLAQYAGKQLPVLHPKDQEKMDLKNRWHHYCDLAAKRFSDQLNQNEQAKTYLYDRGITQSDIDYWKLGFGDDQDKDFANTKERIVFPFFDDHGRIISFTGRTMLDHEQLTIENEKRKQNNQRPIVKYQDRFPLAKDHPKYQMHPYPFFEKGNYLYGFHAAKESIKQKASAVLVEGWLDVISLHRAGITNAVGTMGLSFTDTHAKKLKQAGCKHLLIMRDQDTAGQKAIARDAKQAISHDLSPHVITLPSGMDPHDFICSFSHIHPHTNLFTYLERNTKPYGIFILDAIYHTYEKRISNMAAQLMDLKNKRLNDWMQFVKNYAEPKDQYALTEYLHERYNIQKEFLQIEMKRSAS